MSKASIWSLLMTAFFLFGRAGHAQRTYSEHSILSSGNWFRFAVREAGIYKLDRNFLSNIGINTSSLPSSSIRLFGNGGAMLSEDPGASRMDDLRENALFISDGGDGIIDGNDYILFFAEGPHHWLPDSVTHGFRHVLNLYSDLSYYYISIGVNGLRVEEQAPVANPNTEVNSFDAVSFHELDTFNFLSSGKHWFGEEFSDAPGKQKSRGFDIFFPNLIYSEPISAKFKVAARAFGAISTFTIKTGLPQDFRIELPPVSNGPYDPFVRVDSGLISGLTTSDTFRVSLSFQPGSLGGQGWLDQMEVFGRRRLSMLHTKQLMFRDWKSVSPGNTAHFTVSDVPSGCDVWDITDPLHPVIMQTETNGNQLSFNCQSGSLHQFIAFSNDFLLPEKGGGRVENQDLHKPVIVDYLIITHPDLLPQASRLAAFHEQQEGLKTLVVTTSQVFNEFSSGIPDPSALRDYVKMFYDRAGHDSTKRIKYLLLFGDASFDYKNRITGNTSLVPGFESDNSIDPLGTYTSDDFFGYLEDGDNINGNKTPLLDIGIGRIPAANAAEAKDYVDKLIAYYDPASLGPWRNNFSFVADDQDANLHLEDAESVAATVSATAPDFSVEKIYLDAFRQESGAGGSRYPDANIAIGNTFYNGMLIWNYNGHGGYRRLAEEVVLDQEIVNALDNSGKLPMLITATCDVAPFDNPLVSSFGENMLLRPKTGAIALMTTTRLVFAFSNRVMNNNYLGTALKKINARYLSLGEAVMRAKNITYQFSGDVVNNRKFTLLGDPALTLGYPKMQIALTAINGKPVSATTDTLKALSSCTVEGELRDEQGNIIPDFNGTLFISAFDKPGQITTLANDPDSYKASIEMYNKVIFKGKAQVANGKFSLRFMVPKDINYRFGRGRMSFYAENGKTDGNGSFSGFMVGGSGDSSSDRIGPDIHAFLNDEKFVSGGISNDRPVLIVKLSDSSGINVIGNGVGHDLVAILDNDQAHPFVLNEYYESETDNFRKGTVRFQLPRIEEGIHTVTLKAWDIANNSGESALEFRIIKENKLTLEHVLNYPNPFTTHTTFWFDHNHPGEELKVSIQVYTVTGKLVKTIRTTIFSTGSRSSEVGWDGRDDYGARLGRGVYIYHLKVETNEGKSAQKLEKLYLL